jgi:hypothetical protein
MLYEEPEGYDLISPGDEICASEVAKDKELWIVRIPSSIEPTELNGAKVKLTGQLQAAGKLSGQGGKEYEFQTAESTEFKNYVSMFSSEQSLVLGKPFAREIKLVAASVADASSGKELTQTLHFWDAGYSGVPQKTGLRVRCAAGGGQPNKTNKRKANTPDPAAKKAKKDKKDKKVKKEKKEKKSKRTK